VEADLTVRPVDGLTLAVLCLHLHPRSAGAEHGAGSAERLAQSAGDHAVFETVYILYTPKNALSGSIDYELPVGGAGTELRCHLDGNYSDPVHSFVGEKLMTDKSFIVNGRLSLADIPMSDGGQKLTASAWARNLLNEEHIYRRSGANTSLGDYANYNAPRTFGIDATVQF
jgi:iron complex outermembrane receptor protein